MNRTDTVRRFVDEAVNPGRDELVDELFTPALRDWVRDWSGAFRSSLPDMDMHLLELAGDGDTAVGRSACSATHLGEWRGHAPSGRRFENCAEVYFFRFDGPRIADVWGSRTRWERFRQLALEPGEI